LREIFSLSTNTTAGTTYGSNVLRFAPSSFSCYKRTRRPSHILDQPTLKTPTVQEVLVMTSSSTKLRRLDIPSESLRSLSLKEVISLNESETVGNEEGDAKNHGHHHGSSNKITSHLVLSLAALGAVYGDIGTSPFYTFNAVLGHQLLNKKSPSVPNENDVIGALSNILWCIIIVCVLKFSLIVLRADFNGEGGDFSMYQLVTQQKDKMWNWAKKPLIFIPVAAASLLICDTTITPAITILGALEGLQVVGPQIEKVVVPLAAVIVILLFSFQFKGTGTVGIFFGPFMIIWYLCIGLIGAYNVFWLDLSSLSAFNPWKAINWWITGNYAGAPAFAAMGSVILSVTGAETMYADMGKPLFH
jgi:K+ transporter